MKGLSPSSLPGPCKTETNSQPFKEEPNSPESTCKDTTSESPEDVEQQMPPESPTEIQAVATQSSERELARRKEQERRRREAVSSFIRVLVFYCSSICKKAFLTTVLWFYFSCYRCLVLTWPCSGTSWLHLSLTWTKTGGKKAPSCKTCVSSQRITELFVLSWAQKTTSCQPYVCSWEFKKNNKMLIVKRNTE